MLRVMLRIVVGILHLQSSRVAEEEEGETAGNDFDGRNML